MTSPSRYGTANVPSTTVQHSISQFLTKFEYGSERVCIWLQQPTVIPTLIQVVHAMHDNILSTGDSDIYDVELDELGGSPDSRSVTCNLPPASTLILFRGDNRLVNGQQRTVPLGVELTGFRLLASIMILIGVPMAVYSYN